MVTVSSWSPAGRGSPGSAKRDRDSECGPRARPGSESLATVTVTGSDSEVLDRHKLEAMTASALYGLALLALHLAMPLQGRPAVCPSPRAVAGSCGTLYFRVLGRVYKT